MCIVCMPPGTYDARVLDRKKLHVSLKQYKKVKNMYRDRAYETLTHE